MAAPSHVRRRRLGDKKEHAPSPPPRTLPRTVSGIMRSEDDGPLGAVRVTSEEELISNDGVFRFRCVYGTIGHDGRQTLFGNIVFKNIYTNLM